MSLLSGLRCAPRSAICGLLLAGFLAPHLMAQRNRLSGPIRSRNRVGLAGHTRPQLNSENDEGPADEALVLEDMTMVLRPSAAQQSELAQLLREQQDPSSANYRRWLSPEEYAERFGASPDDVARIEEWMRQQNLDVTHVARARNSVQFRGTARAVGIAFATQIRNYRANGRRHFANATDPSIPADLDLMVAAIHGLDDFRLEPKGVKANAEVQPVPNYTSSSGRHYLAPDDLATIYNVKPLYATGLDGTGQTIVVAGQTQMDLSDVRLFRTRFGLSAADPVTMLVPGLGDPGVSSTDVPEANLDLQWAGAVARNARILYVYSADVMNAVQYAIDQNLAPVISVSYGACELQNSAATLRAYQTWARQANAQGITWVNAAGDSGGADCYRGTSGFTGLSVDAPASVPEVTAIGGTTFVDDSGTYWTQTNGRNDMSALAYIPETVWNDSTTGSPASGGGGASIFFLKPSWQTGVGVPNDGARSVPDIALAASANHDGYLVYTGGTLGVFGGTSAGTPVFAGMLALLNQYLARGGAGTLGVGNVNPRLYGLAQTAPNIFHDVTTGTNVVAVTCGARNRNCVAGSYGYSAGPGYDLASGLGSVDFNNLVTSWSANAGSVTLVTANLTLSSSGASIGPADSVTLTATVTGANGGVPLGNVAFRVGGVSLGTAALTPGQDKSVATWIVTGANLLAGSNTILADYTGSAFYTSATGSTTVNVAQVSGGAPLITGLTNAASFRTVYAPGMLLSVFGSQLAPAAWSAASVPLPPQLAGVSVTINGLTAPLLYVSPSLLNIQIPYEAGAGSPLTVIVNNNGRTATGSFTAAATAPGIFIDSTFAPIPNASAKRGQTISLYITGAGAITPAVATGGAPDPATAVTNLPRPQQTVGVTVGGLPATLQFVGVPWGLVGVVLVNYQVPEGVPLGANALIVQVGDASSAAANLTVTP